MFATVPDPTTPSRSVFVGLVPTLSDQSLVPSDGTITNERVIMFSHGQSVPVRRSSLKQEDRIAKLTNLYFRNNHLSKEHAIIRYDENDGFFIKDTNSTFGTVLNRDKVLIPDIEFPLKNNDEIGFIMSKPSLQIKKTFKSYSGSESIIPLEEFGSPQIAMKFVVDISGYFLRFVPLGTSEKNDNSEPNKELLVNESFISSQDKTREIDEIRKSGTEDEEGEDDEIQILDEETVRAMEETPFDKADEDVHDDKFDPEGLDVHEEYNSKRDESKSSNVVNEEANVLSDNTPRVTEAAVATSVVAAVEEKDDDGELNNKELYHSSDDAPSESDIVYDFDSEVDDANFIDKLSDGELFADGKVDYGDYDDYNDEVDSIYSVDNSDNHDKDEEISETRYLNEGKEEINTSESEFDSDDYDISVLESDANINDIEYHNETESEFDDDDTLNSSNQSIDDSEICSISDDSIEVVNDDEEELHVYARDNYRIHCAPLCYAIEDTECELLNSDCSRKRSFDEMEDDIDYDEDTTLESAVEQVNLKVPEPPRKKILTSQSKWKTITKEVGKGLFYVLATLAALGIYGSTMTDEEN